jgi:F-type H+-transporting ATPase subunit gamma
MATLKQIRGRIKAAKNIQQITRAMKLVAAARLKRATERALAARPYSEKLREVVGSLAGAGDLPDHPLLKSGQSEAYGLILVTAERGLCGSYNTNLIRAAQQFMRESSEDARIVAVGKKGALFFSRRGYRVLRTVHPPSSGPTLADAQDVAQLTRKMFEDGEIGRLFICYSKFYSAIRQVPHVVQLLPIEPPSGATVSVAGGGVATVPVESGHDRGQASAAYSFEPDPATLLEALLPRYFLAHVWQALLEATASEFGARMTAMTSATDNAGKMIQNLTLKANRERQAAITREILEVVGGAEALKA